MKQTDVITIKKVLNNYFAEDLTKTLLEEIIEHTDTDIDDQPNKGGYQNTDSVFDVSSLYPVEQPSMCDVFTACGFLAQTAQGLSEDAEREDILAVEYEDDSNLYHKVARMNREDAESLLRVRTWLHQNLVHFNHGGR